MKQFLIVHKTHLIIISITVIGSFFRFYNLNWGAPFYFHPDERNIAGLITSFTSFDISVFSKGTFSYGTFISTVVLVIKNCIEQIFHSQQFQDPFSQSIILLRTISAISSILTICIVFYIGNTFGNIWKGTLSASLTMLSVGLIQAAHFGVFESFLTFLYITLFALSMTFVKTTKKRYLFFSVVIVSIATATKINSVILFSIPLLLLFFYYVQKRIPFYKFLLNALALVSILVVLTLLFSPYYLTEEFRGLFEYERSLLTGTMPVFYTSEFFSTTPFLYHIFHILPFLINPFLTIIFIISLPYILYIGITKKNTLFLLLTTFFFLSFLPGTLLFAKWTRYMVPVLPFVYLIITFAFFDFFELLKKKLPIKKVLTIRFISFYTITFISLIFAISYTIDVYRNQDTRVAASLWARDNIPHSAHILSEVYDLGITPFNQYFSTITLFNFYDLETNPITNYELNTHLSNSDYIILPSQRIMKSRLLNPDKFPKGYEFYSRLVAEKLGYKKVYETPCNMLCKIVYINNPIFSFEETASVFDRPTVMIFKRN